MTDGWNKAEIAKDSCENENGHNVIADMAAGPLWLQVTHWNDTKQPSADEQKMFPDDCNEMEWIALEAWRHLSNVRPEHTTFIVAYFYDVRAVNGKQLNAMQTRY